MKISINADSKKDGDVAFQLKEAFQKREILFLTIKDTLIPLHFESSFYEQIKYPEIIQITCSLFH